MGKGTTSQHTTASRTLGFTIVELLVVIVVIAILATITILSYNSVTQRAHQSSVQTDANNIASAMETYYTNVTDGKSFATALSQLNNGTGYAASDNNTINFYSEGDSYCVSVVSSHDSVIPYHVTDTTHTPEVGLCPQDIGSTVATAAGTGTGGATNGVAGVSQTYTPAGVVSNGSGFIYFSDGGTNRIRGLNASSTQTYTYAGSGTASAVNGTGTTATFSWPQALAVDASGNIYVADSNNHRIRKVVVSSNTTNNAGVASTFSGSTSGATTTIGTAAASMKMNTPRGVAYDATTGDIVVADTQNNRIIRLDGSTGNLKAVYGTTTGAFANGTASTARFNYPEGVAVDSNGIIYVADTNNNRIRKIDTSGNVTTLAGDGTAGYIDANGTSAEFNKPGALTISSKGIIYVSDTVGARIRRIATNGDVKSIAGNGTAGYAEGQGTAAQFNAPMGIALGSNGKLYVADTNNYRIRVLDAY